MTSLHDVKAALLLVLPTAVYHMQAPSGTSGDYLIWAEDTAGHTLHSNNHQTHQSIEGTIDLYTQTEFSPHFSKVQKALSLRGIPYRLSSVQYEQDTGYFHYEWVFEVEHYG